jgi:hypothetical protein
MATKKKTSRKKKSTKRQKTAARKVTAKKQTRKAKPRKKPAKKAAARSKTKRKSPKQVARATTARVSPRETSTRSQGRRRAGFSPEVEDPDSGGQAGDLQGLSNVESADSESVDELLEEGNAFEAGVVEGVEDSGNRGVREVRTREVPEDDVPQEYLDED